MEIIKFSTTFKFGITDKVKITASGETGNVIGAAVFVAAENSYLIRYKAADGRATEAWWNESALEADVETTVSQSRGPQ